MRKINRWEKTIINDNERWVKSLSNMEKQMIYVCIEQLILRISIKKKTNSINLRYSFLHFTMMTLIII